jgi:hypothetical protein
LVYVQQIDLHETFSFTTDMGPSVGSCPTPFNLNDYTARSTRLSATCELAGTRDWAHTQEVVDNHRHTATDVYTRDTLCGSSVACTASESVAAATHLGNLDGVDYIVDATIRLVGNSRPLRVKLEESGFGIRSSSIKDAFSSTASVRVEAVGASL